MFMEFSEECQKIILQAKREMFSLKHPYVGSEHFLLAILKNKNNDITIKLSTYGIDYDIFRNKLIELVGCGMEENDWFLFTPLFKRVIENAMMDSKDRNNKMVSLENLFIALIEEGEGVAVRILLSLGMDIDKFYAEYISYSKQSRKKKTKRNTLEEFGIDFTEKASKGEFDPVIGRNEEIEQIIETLLRRKKNNPLLIGKAGVGKTAIVEELARRIYLGKVPDVLKNKKIISVSMAALVSGTKYRGEFEERINKLISELEKNKDYILFIDEIHTLVGAGGAEGAIDAANIFKPVLSRGGFSLIGATTENEYRKYIEDDKALERRFQVIKVSEPDSLKVLDILLKIKKIYEKYYNLEISDNILKEIIKLTDEYIFTNQQPDKSIEILDSACCHSSLIKDNIENKIIKYKEELNNAIMNKNNSILSNDFEKASYYLKEEKNIESIINNLFLKNKNNKKKKILSMDSVVKVIESKSKIPIYKYSKRNVNIDEKLKKIIIGQDNIIDELCFETKRKLYGLKYNNRPLSFLFVGSSGVGKTYMAELYNELLYKKDNLIRLDMSEYGESYSISKILGSPSGYIGYNDGNNILNKIKSKPNAVLLLDEIEKASHEVINLFLQILDNGIIKDAKGEEIKFSHVTIIMTSNIGFKKKNIGFHEDKDNKVLNEIKDILGVEFVNRINKTLIFNNIKESDIGKIIKLKFQEKKKLYEDLNIKMSLNKNLIEKIKSKCKYDEFGARRIDRIMEEELDNIAILKINEKMMVK